ncbi:hypothetical protein KAU04_05395, partial [bacterium]|nr:hypothetical protein [bacterium]
MEESYPELPEGVSFQKDSGVGEQETRLSGLEFALEYLKPFEEKRGLLNKLGTARVELDEQEYRKLLAEFTGQEVVRSCRKLERDRVGLSAELNEKDALKQQMGTWANLDIPFEDLGPTVTNEVILGSVPGGQFAVLSQRLAEEAEVYHLELVGKSALEEHCLLLYHRRESDAVASVLDALEFTEKRFPNLQGTPEQVIDRLDREMASLRKSLHRLDEESR